MNESLTKKKLLFKRRQFKRKLFIIGIVTLIIIGIIGSKILFNFNDTAVTVTITDKERIYSHESSKYLVFGEDKDGNSFVFENTDCFIRGKWNSSDIQGQLKEGNTYEIIIVGYRVPFLSWYQNIIKINN
jgi:hypothetical protein